ncbi:MAG: aminotransferase class V-fold PLP-dependent enzyme [Planctomycetota bacterium]|nr:aminotransferase class V-fold PLP-dependent enzyme [Planctomycetota bacterium]
MSNEVFNDELLREIRSRFCHVDSDPAAGRRVHFESAGGSLKLRAAVQQAAEIAARPDNAGRDNAASRDLDAIISTGRRDVALFSGALGGQIVSGESTTANIFRLVEAALAGESGSNVVTTQLEHPCVTSATKLYAAQYGLQRRVVPITAQTGEISPIAIAGQVDDRTAALVCIHASNVIGTRINIGAVAEQVRRRNPRTLIVIDGSQHAPHGLIDVESLGIDAYCFAPYKVFSILGTCFAWLSQRLATREHPRLLDTPVTQWELGTRDPAAFGAWSAVVDYLVWLSAQLHSADAGRREHVIRAMSAIDQHERALGQQLLAGFARIPRLRLIGVPNADERREAVFAFAIDGLEAAAVNVALADRGIFVHVRRHDAYSGQLLDALHAPDCVRASFAHYNSPDEVDSLLEALMEIAY